MNAFVSTLFKKSDNSFSEAIPLLDNDNETYNDDDHHHDDNDDDHHRDSSNDDDATPDTVDDVGHDGVEGGVLGGPVMITGTYSVGAVRDAVNSYFHEVLKTPGLWINDKLVSSGRVPTTVTVAGWLREQVCLYMCPYARFQSAMFDKETLIVSYDAERGEPRPLLPFARPFSR